MTTRSIHIFSALPAAGSEIPAQIHLVPFGTFKGNDGRGPFTLEARHAQALISASMKAGKLAVDENHSIDFAAPNGQPSPARGWITQLHAKADGIWGDVEWTASGRQMMADQAYRGISPALEVMKAGGRVVGILRASLTNDPNLSQLKTLHSKETSMDLMAQLRQALQLDNDADDQAVIAAVGALSKQVSTQASQKSALTTLAQMLDIKADSATVMPADQVVEAVKVLQANAAKAGDNAQLVETVKSLQTKVTELQAANAKVAAEAEVDAAITAGKPVKVLRDHYITRHMADPAGVKKELDAMPSMHSGGIPPDRKTSAVVGEGASQQEIQRATMAYQAEQKAKGIEVDHATAVLTVVGRL